MTNFNNPAITTTTGTILATVLNIKYKEVTLDTAINNLQLATDAYKAFKGQSGRTCYEEAKTYLTEKPIATYISGLSKLYGNNGVTKSNAKAYTKKAISKGNNKGIFIYTGDITKNCITLTKDFKESKIKGYTRNKEASYAGVGTKYNYIIAEYKANGYYYPSNTKKKEQNVILTKYDFSKGEKTKASNDRILEALAKNFQPLEVYAAKTNNQNNNATSTTNKNNNNNNQIEKVKNKVNDAVKNAKNKTTETSGNTNTDANSNNDEDTDSNNANNDTSTESSTTAATTTTTTPAVESTQEKKYNLDTATYSYDEVTDENIMTQPVLFYGTDYERAVDNTTSMLLRNILKNASALSIIKSKSSRFLYMNCYGDIVTDDNLVILPGASNPLLYSDNANYNPYTAAWMNNYPSNITNSENLQFTSKNDVGKYLAMANTMDEDYTDADVSAYLINGDDSVDETSEIALAKLQREFYANSIDSLDILSTGRYAIGSYQNWKNSDLYNW